jgi:hypothetical protein
MGGRGETTMTMTWATVIPGLWRSQYRTTTSIDAVAYVLALSDGELAVVSPPGSADDAVFAATEALGKVVALIANNSGHDLGQALWQKRYPNAVTYAPEAARGAIAKAKPALRPIQPLADLIAKLPGHVTITDVPGTSSGMTLFSIDSGDGGRALFVDEIIGNSPHLIGPAPFRLVFWLTGSGPGLSRNKIWAFMFAKDKKGVAGTVLAQLDALKPTVVLVAHGDPILPDKFDELRALLGAI